jgi:hypothetical protein
VIEASDELASPRLVVAWQEPDPAQPWLIVERSHGVDLARLESLTLEDA